MDQLRPATDINSQINTQPPINTVSFPENPAPSVSTTREYDIENIKPENKMFTVDLMGEDADVSFARIKTPDAKPDVNNNNTSYINPSPMSGPGGSNSAMGSMGMGMPLIKSRDELRSGVKAAIMVVDYVISLIAMKIAGSNDQRGYTADSSQRKLLEDVIVEYLFGKQKQMPLWLTLVFAIAGSYGLILFGAIRQRNQISKAKKLAQGNDTQYTTPAPTGKMRPGSGGQQGYYQGQPAIRQDDVRKYEVARPGHNPQEKLTLNKVYSDVNKDGVMEPVNQPSFTDVIQGERPKSSPSYPDEKLTADSSKQAMELALKGVYPKYKKNLNGKIIAIKYGENGLPIMAGKPPKVIKRK